MRCQLFLVLSVALVYISLTTSRILWAGKLNSFNYLNTILWWGRRVEGPGKMFGYSEIKQWHEHVVTPPEECKQLARTERTVTGVKPRVVIHFEQDAYALQIRVMRWRDTRAAARFLRDCRLSGDFLRRCTGTRRWRDLASRRPSAQRRRHVCVSTDVATMFPRWPAPLAAQQRRTGFKHAVSLQANFGSRRRLRQKAHSPIFRATSDPLTY